MRDRAEARLSGRLVATLILSFGMVACAGQSVGRSAATEWGAASYPTLYDATEPRRQRQSDDLTFIEVCEQVGTRMECGRFSRERVREDLERLNETLRLDAPL